MNRMRTLATVFFTFLLLVSFTVAHQPRLVGTSVYNTVDNPEISHAFYGEFPGEPVFYTIQSNITFRLYVGLLVPDSEGIETDVSAEIYQNDKLIAVLNGTEFTWKPYYEEFAGDDYFQGPEYSATGPAGEIKGKSVDAGTYVVKVSRPSNKGKYVVAIGDIEAFPPGEIIRTTLALPAIKKFMGKSPLAALASPSVIKYLLPTLAGIVLAVVLSTLAVKKIRKLRKKRR